MKRALSLPVAFLLFGVAAYAQDVDFGAFDDPGSLLTPIAPASRGAAPARGAAAPAAPPDRLVRLREVLVKAEQPLTKDQEAELNKLMAAEIPVMRRTLQTHGQQMLAARAASAPPGAGEAAQGAPSTAPTPAASAATAPATPTAPPSAAARGAAPPAGAPNPALLAAALAARGAPPSSRVPAEVLDALEVEMRQMNDALFTKVSSSPALTPGQQSVLTKMARAQIRSRGGFDALRIAMEDAGAPLSEEQLPKVQALFEDQKTARAALARESQATPDPAKLKQLERDTLTKVVGLLVPAQRTALLALLRSQQ
jgi:hypothetical protein